MIPLEEARSFVLERCPAGIVASVPVDDALRLVTSDVIRAQGPIPPFDNTAMDGFAIRSVDVRDAPVSLNLAGTIAAGSRPDVVVGPGDAVRIMTGAPMPSGADAVVMVELTAPSADGRTVEVLEAVPVGNHIRPTGDDVQPGQVVFEAGTSLGPAHLGMCTSIGVYDVPVHKRPRVGVISTGDELVDSARPLEIGQIHDSNRHTLLALVRETGAEPVDLGVVSDNEAPIRDALTAAAENCDAVITSGGVSMGDFDYVKKVLGELGDMRWMQVAIKPAKPLAFGTVRGTPIFGLPGNPVSSMVSFELFARPGIRQMMGHRQPMIDPVIGFAGADLARRPDGKIHFARVVVEQNGEGRYEASYAGGQGSHQLSAMAAANALAIIPDGDGVRAGQPVELIML